MTERTISPKATLAALKEQYPRLTGICVATAIRPGEWYLQELICPCQTCGANQAAITLAISEEQVLDAMALWPDAQFDRNTSWERG